MKVYSRATVARYLSAKAVFAPGVKFESTMERFFIIPLAMTMAGSSSFAVLLDNATSSDVSSSRGIDGYYGGGGVDDFKYLVFPQGSNVQLVYCLTMGILMKPEGLHTMGVTAGVAYELPYRRIMPFPRTAEAYHGRRNRRDLYLKFEKMLDSQKKNGRDCILRALCRSGKRNREREAGKINKMTFIDEILHAIFTYPDGRDVTRYAAEISRDAEYELAYNAEVDCHEHFDSCPLLF